MAIALIKAEKEDTATIAKLAEIIWKEHYPSIITDDQINYMLGEMYSGKTLEEQIISGKQLFYLIKHAGKDAGFISVSKTGEQEWMLNKFYILKTERGIGSEVFSNILAILSPKIIRLTVNRQNYKSINFYFKNGFVIEKVADFNIGNGFFMNDFVMIWKKI